MRCISFFKYPFFISALAASSANGQLMEGESVISCFPGVANGKIDLTESVSGIVDTRNPAAAPQNPPVNWPAPMRGKILPEETGLVFGIAIDHAPVPNIYTANSAAFGLHIVNSDDVTVSEGQPGARWMEGQFGQASISTAAPHGEPAIYKINSQTNAVTRFGTLTNDGPGFGNIAFNPYTAQARFYVSDLSNGMIYHLDQNGVVLNPAGFDHGLLHSNLADSGIQMAVTSSSFNSRTTNIADGQSKWGLTQSDRLVWGLGVHKRQGEALPRLYYAVGAGSNAQIFSVSLGAGGNIGADIVDENVDLSGAASTILVSDIAFSDNDKMLIAERGGIRGIDLINLQPNVSSFYSAHTNRVIQYQWQSNSSTWAKSPTTHYSVGQAYNGKNSTGGIDFSYGLTSDFNADLEQCDERFVAMGDYLQPSGNNTIYGLQHSPLASQPNVYSQSYLVDVDTQLGVLEKTQNGDVEVYRKACRSTSTTPAGLCDLTITGPACAENGNTTFNIQVNNHSGYTASDLNISFPGLPSTVTPQVTINNVGNPQSTASVELDGSYSGPLEVLASLTSATNDEGMSLCCERRETVEINACNKSCLILDGEWLETGMGWAYAFTATDNSNANFTPSAVFIDGIPAGAHLSPNPRALSNGQASGIIQFAPGTQPGTTFSLTAVTSAGDQCCKAPFDIAYPEEPVSCEPKLDLDKRCAIERRRYLCSIKIFDRNDCSEKYDFKLVDQFHTNDGATASIIGLVGNQQDWAFNAPDVFASNTVSLPTGFTFEVDANKIKKGENCVELYSPGHDGPVLSRCVPIPETP